MPKYRVTVLVDATVSVEVEAANEDEAREKGLLEAPTPCICHQCSRELEVGEPYEVAEVSGA